MKHIQNVESKKSVTIKNQEEKLESIFNHCDDRKHITKHLKDD